MAPSAPLCYNRIMKARKNMKTKQIKNFKMNDAVYKLRRQVIELIYEAKKEIKDLRAIIGP
jgi:hypothetical protein